MRSRLPKILTVLLLVSAWGSARAQSLETNAVMILRAQATSIAQDVVGKLGSSLPDSGRVVVRVESHANKTMIENAFLETLNRSVLKPLLPMNAPPGVPALDVLVLDQSVSYREIGTGAFERTVKTNLEARFQPEGNSSVEYLGLYRRATADTVAHRDDLQVFGSDRESPTGEASFFDKIAAPVLMITGAFLIVYLFFTVRNG
jgi:hypothetical protein